jgi:ABC-type transport system involved in multi-copper enzyme maturation permease subunit
MFRWELVRLARRGQVTRLRVLSLYCLLLAVLFFPLFWTPLPGGQTNPAQLFSAPAWNTREAEDPAGYVRLSNSLALVLLEVQLLFVAVAAPAIAAGAIAEEKDRETLPLLLTTQLTIREIVWWKAAGRLALILATVVAGLPVILLTLFLGGAGIQLIATGYALILGTAVLGVAIGTSAGCRCPDSRTALIRAHGMSAVLIGCGLLPPFVMASPFLVLAYSAGLEWPAGVRPGQAIPALVFAITYPLAQCGVAIALLSRAARGLRSNPPPPPEPTAYPEPPRGRPEPIPLDLAMLEPEPLPPIDDSDPVLWKERHFARTRPLPFLASPARWSIVLSGLVALGLFLAGAWQFLATAVEALHEGLLESVDHASGAGTTWAAGNMIAAGMLASGLYLLPLAIGITGSVARERQRGTLDSLLGTTIARRSILWSKARAYIERGLILGVGAVTALGCGFGVLGGGYMGFAAMGAVSAGYGLVIGLGTYLSVRSATPTQAFRLVMPAVAGVLMMPVFGWQLAAPGEPLSTPFTIAVLAAVLCACAGCAFWMLAVSSLARGDREELHR